MFPAWIKPALVRGGILALACIALIVGVVFVSGNIHRPLPAPPQVAAESNDAGAPAAIVPVTASDPGTPVKQEGKATEPDTREPKLISLYEAVGLFEKTGKGEVVSAEKVGDGDKAIFNLDVVGAKGGKTRFHVNATGRVIVEVPPPPVKKGNKKGR
jgi:hypothetical protein